MVTSAMCLTSTGTPALGDDDVTDVVGRAQQADAADQVLLAPLLDVAAARVRVAVGQRVEQLLQRDLWSQLGEVGVHLVLLDEAAQADHVGDPRHQLELALDDPVLDRAQLAGSAVDPSGSGTPRRSRWTAARARVARPGQVGLAQALGHLLPGEIRSRLVVEGDDQKRQAELRVGEHAHGIGQASQRDLERDGDLLLDLFRRASGVQGDDGHLRVRNIRKGLDRKLQESCDPAAHEQDRAQQHEHRLAQPERDDALNHLRCADPGWHHDGRFA